jgi:hypothetical protein
MPRFKHVPKKYRRFPHGFSFCETLAATGPWHIRRLTAEGMKLHGGADTKTLCGLNAAWDTPAEISTKVLSKASEWFRPGRPCPACTQAYNAHVERGDLDL